MKDLEELLNMIFESNKKAKEKEQKKKVSDDDETESIRQAAAACKKVYNGFIGVGFSEEFAEELILRIIDKILKIGD